MKYKLLVLDIDGTVTNSEKIITQKTKEAVIKAQKNSVIAVLASGRPYGGMEQYAKELELDRYGGYMLSFNGGKITSCKTGETIFEKSLTFEEAKEIYELSKEFSVSIVSYLDDYVIGEKKDEFVDIECQINKLKLRQVDSIMDSLKLPVPKFLMLADGDYLEKVEAEIKKRLGDRFCIFRSEPYLLEIMPKNIDKAYSLNILAKKLGIKTDEVIACGDGFNDVSMISFAGLGVAMENAQPTVKAASDFITLSNNHDGIAHVVDKFIFNIA